MGQQYVELRFENGWVLSGFVDDAARDSLELREVDGVTPRPKDAPLFGERFSVLLKDQRCRAFAGAVTDAVVAFHQRDEG